MTLRHRLLQRQVRKALPHGYDPSLLPLLQAVDQAYTQLDADRALIERSLEISSSELSELNATLRERLAQIQAMQQQLVAQEKLASLGGLTAGIAHEIKNPLNFINNFADLSAELAEELVALLQQGDPVSLAEAMELAGTLQGNLTIVARHGRRADAIVRGMLQHARGQGSAHQLLDLNGLVEENTDLAFHGFRARNPQIPLEVHKQLDPKVRQVHGSAQDLARVLLNVMGNACEAAGESGGPGVVDVVTKDLGHAVQVRIRNTGSGVPAELAERIFEPFFTTKPPGSGTGLGLSISHDIVQSHGGTLRLTSLQPAEFTVELPYPTN